MSLQGLYRSCMPKCCVFRIHIFNIAAYCINMSHLSQYWKSIRLQPRENLERRRSSVAKPPREAATLFLLCAMSVRAGADEWRLSTPIWVHLHWSSHVRSFGSKLQISSPLQKQQQSTPIFFVWSIDMSRFCPQLACLCVYTVHCTVLALLCLHNMLRQDE